MSKITLSKRDKSAIERMQQNSAVHTYLRNKQKTIFNIGDVLIKKFIPWNDGSKVEVERVSKSSNAPKKYMCIHIDNYGVPYVKHLKVDGTLAEGIHSVCDMGLDSSWYEADPEFAEHILLGEDEKYDPLEKFRLDKEQRNKIKEANRRIREKTNTREEIKNLIDKISVGSYFWISDQRDTCLDITEYKVLTKHEHTLSEIKRLKGGRLYNAENQLVNFKANYGGSDKFWVLDVEINGSPNTVTEYIFGRANTFLTKPTSVKDK